jgi:carboxylesterase
MKAYDQARFDHSCCKPFYFQGNEHGILLIHGFTGSVAHMRPLGDALREKGYTVKGINLPGHALDEQAMRATDWRAWLQAAKEAALELQGSCRTLTVCGLSMGGLLALLIAEQMKPDACVTISTPMATRNRLLPMARLTAPFYPRVAWRSQESRHEGLDQAYDYGYSGFPTKSAADLRRLIRLARQNLFAVTCPVLCVQSEADETVWEGSAEYILGNVASASRQRLWLKGVPHLCTISKELPAIAAAVDQLLIQVKRDAEAVGDAERIG